MSQLCSKNVMTARTKYTRRGSMRELTVTLAHLLQDSDKPPLSEGLRQVTDLCSKNKCRSYLDVILMHTTLYRWAWTSTNEENGWRNIWYVQHFIFLTKVWSLPWSLAKQRKVIDLTIATDKTGNLLTKWHVFDKIPCQTTDTYYFKLPGSHAATPREPLENPIG